MNIDNIKKALECCLNPKLTCCNDCPYNNNGRLRSEMLKDALNLINELERENKRLKKDCTDIANDYQEMGKFYNEEVEKNQQLNYRVKERERTLEEQK